MIVAKAGSVSAIVLAAGASTRLGEPKQLVVFEGERLLERAIRVAAEAGCEPVIVVLGASADEILARLDPKSVTAARFIRNPQWPDGMASSIRAGVSALKEKVDGTVILTCDQPAVSPVHLQDLMNRNRAETTASDYAGKRGVPAYFPQSTFVQLQQLDGESGARPLLIGAAAIALPGGEFDIDTPADLLTLRRVR